MKGRMAPWTGRQEDHPYTDLKLIYYPLTPDAMLIRKNLALSDTGFVFNPSTGDSYSVNPIGLEVLRMLKDQKKEAEIKAQLLQTYQADAETIEKDLYDFMKALEQLKLTENG